MRTVNFKHGSSPLVVSIVSGVAWGRGDVGWRKLGVLALFFGVAMRKLGKLRTSSSRLGINAKRKEIFYHVRSRCVRISWGK